jgi:hypothetical protein
MSADVQRLNFRRLLLLRFPPIYVLPKQQTCVWKNTHWIASNYVYFAVQCCHNSGVTSVFPNFYALLSGLLVISAWHIKTLSRYDSIEYVVVDNETCFSSLWVQESGILRSVVQSLGLHVRVWTGLIGLRLWIRNCEHGIEAVGAMYCCVATNNVWYISNACFQDLGVLFLAGHT